MRPPRIESTDEKYFIGLVGAQKIFKTNDRAPRANGKFRFGYVEGGPPSSTGNGLADLFGRIHEVEHRPDMLRRDIEEEIYGVRLLQT